MVDLTQAEMIIGISFTIIMIIDFILALVLIIKYMSNKDKKILYFALYFTFLALNAVSNILNFYSYLTTGGPISANLYGFFIFVIRPIAYIFWMLLITELIYKDRQKLILGIFAVYWIISLVISLYFFFTNISALIVEVGPPGAIVITPLTSIIAMPTTLIMIVTSYLFFRESHKSDNPEIRLKGTLLLLGILVQIVGAIIFLITGNIIPLNIILIPGLLLMYGAIAMPDWIKKRLVKKEQ